MLQYYDIPGTILKSVASILFLPWKRDIHFFGLHLLGDGVALQGRLSIPQRLLQLGLDHVRYLPQLRLRNTAYIGTESSAQQKKGRDNTGERGHNLELTSEGKQCDKISRTIVIVSRFSEVPTIRRNAFPYF